MKIVDKIGMDKFAHFGVGGLITACVSVAMLLQEGQSSFSSPMLCALPLAGTLVTLLLSVLKELIIDSRRDWKDVLASLAGSAAYWLAHLYGVWMGAASSIG